jgi:prolyl-tRNA editing enzyme YbaK/EbsC (Cys-tRNA(Pro) deacylase)
MHEYDQKLRQFMQDKRIPGEHLIFAQSCHSVEEAAQAANVTRQDLVKNICMLDAQGNLIVAIVKGEDRVSTSRVAKALQIERPRIANPDEILAKTGYPCGGTPSFGYAARFLVDPRVMEKAIVYTGGGSERALVRIAPQELQKANHAQVVRIRP